MLSNYNKTTVAVIRLALNFLTARKMRQIVVVLLVISLLRLTSGWSSCSLSQQTISHVLDENTGCSVELGTRGVCEDADNCISKTLPGWGNYYEYSGWYARRFVYYCKVDEYQTISGFVPRSAIMEDSRCSSYAGGGLRFKYVDARTCVCGFGGLMNVQ